MAVTGHFTGFLAPYHYVFAVRGVAVTSGDDSQPDLTQTLDRQLLDHDPERDGDDHRRGRPDRHVQHDP